MSSSGVSAETSLRGQGEEPLRTPLWLSTQYLSTPSSSALLSIQLRVHKPARAFCLAERSNPHILAVSPDPSPVWGKWNRRSWCFLWFQIPTYTIIVLKAELLHFWPVALVSYSDTWQLSSLVPGSANNKQNSLIHNLKRYQKRLFRASQNIKCLPIHFSLIPGYISLMLAEEQTEVTIDKNITVSDSCFISQSTL